MINLKKVTRIRHSSTKKGSTCFNKEDALVIAREIGFPVLVRPNYVLGGRAMEIVYAEEELARYMDTAVDVNPEHPILIDKYMIGKELEVDAICDGETVVIPGIMEHIERAGVHSGDSIAMYPPQNISEKSQSTIDRIYRKISKRTQIGFNEYSVCTFRR